MKQVYKAGRDRRFAYFELVPEGPHGPFDGYIFTGKRIGDRWIPPKVYRLYPTREPWDVAPYLNISALVITSLARRRLGVLVENASMELLPFSAEGTEFFVVNVLEVPNCLNHDACRYGEPPESRLIEYAFFPQRFTRSLFKLPESLGHVFVAEDTSRPEWGFKSACERYGLRGLKYELLWQSE
jgi:hypothetical protein